MRCWQMGVCGSAVAVLLVLGSLPPSARSQSLKADQEEAEATDAESEKVDIDAARLEAIGGLSAVNAQHTYLLIGVISDAHVKGVYQGRQVRTLMKGVIQQIGSLSGMLNKLRDGNLGEEDDEYIDQIVEIHSLLQAQARALSGFAAEPVEDKADAFEAARQASLKALNNNGPLLG